jgi:regulator of sirC expression with transglutaminase-like and TPR domain
MAGYLHFEAPTTLDYFAALVADDSAFPLLEAAISLAQDDDPGLDVQGVLAQVDSLAQRLKTRVPADAAPLHRLRLLNHYFFNELGFAGNVNNYYDPRNSLVPDVLASRRGIPITLALLYLELAGHAGVQAQAVSFPGHFLIKVHLPKGEAIIDPFNGQSLSRDRLEERLLPFRQQQGLLGDDEVPLGLYLQPATCRDVIARMLRNLKEIHRSALDWQRMAAVQHRLVLLLPQEWAEHRDHALALAELGQHSAAAQALAPYLQHQPDAADAAALRRYLAAWRGLH